MLSLQHRLFASELSQLVLCVSLIRHCWQWLSLALLFLFLISTVLPVSYRVCLACYFYAFYILVVTFFLTPISYFIKHFCLCSLALLSLLLVHLVYNSAIELTVFFSLLSPRVPGYLNFQILIASWTLCYIVYSFIL